MTQSNRPRRNMPALSLTAATALLAAVSAFVHVQVPAVAAGAVAAAALPPLPDTVAPVLGGRQP